MKSVVGFLGAASGILSLVFLAKSIFQLGFVAPLDAALSWYQALVEALFTPIAPLVEATVDWISQYMRVELSPGWRHNVVLGGVCLGAAGRLPNNEEALFAAVMLAGGIVGASLSGLPAAFAWLVPALVVAMLGFMVAGQLLIDRRLSVRVRETFAYVASLLVVVGGAILFIALNAGLSLAGVP